MSDCGMKTCIVGCVCKGLIWDCMSNLNASISCAMFVLVCICVRMLDALRLWYSIIRPLIFSSPLWFPFASARTKSCSKQVDIWITLVSNGFGGTFTGSCIKFGIRLSPSVHTCKKKPSHILQKEMLVVLYKHNNFALLQQWGKIGWLYWSTVKSALLVLGSSINSLTIVVCHTWSYAKHITFCSFYRIYFPLWWAVFTVHCFREVCLRGIYLPTS